VERQIERDLLEELLQAKEAEIGPPSSGIQEWAEEIFREAETMAADERAAEERERDGDPERIIDTPDVDDMNELCGDRVRAVGV
jgi:hypothetical protein